MLGPPHHCHIFRPRSKMNAVGRNVFMEEAAFTHQRTMLFDFKHGIKLKCGE